MCAPEEGEKRDGEHACIVGKPEEESADISRVESNEG